jgi:hypothetical protein
LGSRSKNAYTPDKHASTTIDAKFSLFVQLSSLWLGSVVVGGGVGVVGAAVVNGCATAAGRITSSLMLLLVLLLLLLLLLLLVAAAAALLELPIGAPCTADGGRMVVDVWKKSRKK